jgi:opacity protein-like surface antigen
MIKLRPNSVLILVTLVVIATSNTLHAQMRSRREVYDSLLVGDRITPAVSSVMMPKSYTEVILSNTLLTTNSYFTVDRVLLDINQRYSYLFNTLQVTHGISSSGRFNVGMDLSYRTGRQDIDPESSPLKVIGNSGEGLVQYERALTSIGIRARYIPFGGNANFVIQNTFTIPFSTSSADNIFLGDNRYAFNTQLLYNHLLGRKVFLFGQLDVLVRFKNDYANTDITSPINVYASYLLNKHLFPFALIGMSNNWSRDFDHMSQSFTYGVGLQYQFTSMLTINAFYNDIFAGENSNRWKGFNLGIRAVL